MIDAILPRWLSLDARRVLVARGLRAFGDGFVALLVPIYLYELGFSALAIGAIVTSTLIGTAFLTLWVGMVANRHSRRRLLLAAAVLMAATGAGFAFITAFWPLMVIAFVGTMNPTSGDASIFLPLEQTALTQTIEPQRRTALFARYSVIGSLAGAIGVLAASLPDLAAAWTGYSRTTAMQSMFVLYALLGVVSLMLYRPLSAAVEAPDEVPHRPLQQSKRLVYGLAALFGMDSFGTGFLVQSLLALWLYQSFQISVTTAASILFWSGICSAISYFVAVPIADHRVDQHDGFHPSAVEYSVDPDTLRAGPHHRNRPTPGAQRPVANGCADPSLICHGCCRARGAARGSEHHRGAQDFRLGRRLADLRLPPDAFDFWLAIADRRRGEGGVRHLAAGQVPEGAPAGGTGHACRLRKPGQELAGNGLLWRPVHPVVDEFVDNAGVRESGDIAEGIMLVRRDLA